MLRSKVGYSMNEDSFTSGVMTAKNAIIGSSSKIGFLYTSCVSNVKEVKARGAVVMGVTTEEHEHMDDVADYTVKIPATHEMLLPSLTVIPLQLFGYYVASLKGCDIDKPRNLAKSVTVE